MIKNPVAVGVFGYFLADVIKILPCPSAVRQGNVFFGQEGLIDKHEGHNAVHGQGEGIPVVKAVTKGRRVIAVFVKILVGLHQPG